MPTSEMLFIIIGEERIRLNSIKNYGIRTMVVNEIKVYELEIEKGFFVDKAKWIHKGKIYTILQLYTKATRWVGQPKWIWRTLYT